MRWCIEKCSYQTSTDITYHIGDKRNRNELKEAGVDEKKAENIHESSENYQEDEIKRKPKRFYLGNDIISEDEDSGYDYKPTGLYDYEVDPSYNGPVYPSQACHKNGVSYTPPGWRRRYVHKKELKHKPVTLDSLFDF